MKVATINVHTPYLYSLSRIKHEIHCLINLPQGQPWRYWDDLMRPKPENIREVDYSDFKAEDYDVLILHTPEHRRLPFVKSKLPKIFVEHNIDPNSPQSLHDISDTSFTIIFNSELNKQRWKLKPGVRGVVIENGIPDEFYPWEGQERRVLSVVNHFAERDQVCGFNLWRKLTRGLSTKVIGYGNPGLDGPTKDFDELKREYSLNRVYFHTTISDSCLAMREAMMTGMPIVTHLEEVPFENEVEIFKSENLRKMREYLELCLDHPGDVKGIAEAGKKKALQLYDINKFTQRWEKLLRQTTGINT